MYQMTSDPSVPVRSGFVAFLASVACVLALLLLCTFTQRWPRFSGQVELLFPSKSETRAALEREQSVFENVQTDVVLLQKPTQQNSADFVFDLEEFELAVAALAGVESVSVPLPGSENPFGLTHASGEFVRALIRVRGDLPESARRDLHRELGAVLQEFAYLQPARGGSFMTTRAVAERVEKDAQRVVPYVVLMLATVVFCATRHIAVCIITMLATGMSMATAVLTFSLLGYSLGPVSQLALPFLLAIGTSFNLHVCIRLFREESVPVAERLRELKTSIAFAASTTAVSLITLLFLDVADVSHFAVLATGGVLLAGMQAVTVPCLFLPLVQSRIAEWRFPVVRWLRAISNSAVMVVVGVFCILCGIGILRLTVHTDPLNFLPPESEEIRAITELRARFPGNHFLSLLITAPGPEPLDSNAISMLAGAATDVSGVIRVIAPGDFQNRSFSSGARQFLKGFSLRDTSVPAAFRTADGRQARVLIETPLEGAELLELRQSIDAMVAPIAKAHSLAVDYTSIELILAEVSQKIVFGLLESLTCIVGVVFVLLLISCRSFLVACAGLLPNIIPLVTVFGILGYLTGELNFGSCLVGSAALGIAVDNTFHFLLCWKRHERAGVAPVAAVDYAVRTTCMPFAITSLSLIAGFLTMCFAEAVPVRHFGLLLGCTLSIGLFADLVVLPYALTLIGRKVPAHAIR